MSQVGVMREFMVGGRGISRCRRVQSTGLDLWVGERVVATRDPVSGRVDVVECVRPWVAQRVQALKDMMGQ